ncbi:DMT family transporter [Parasphingopyxis algicola]|uniref:DMT family transporter n=1 Tax=Parasphingopyxis algicola TaxID=2026624 RepID=UPI0015A403EB|nr:DMT family transporter [Parasphingopyxis algicola]QLC24604.1 DMT family transporter [Parasphingopyxis algicola]
MALKTPGNPQNTVNGGDATAIGLLLALAGFACLSMGDGIVKSMAGEWPGLAVAALRYSIGALGLLVLLLILEGRKGLRCPRPWVQLGRGVSVGLATLFFFSSIFVMPLADATAIQFTAPMITAILSTILLGERMPRITWYATGIAFLGMILVLRPNVFDLGWVVLLPIGAAICFSFTIIFNRMAAGTGSGLLMQVLISAIATPVLILAAALGHYSGAEALQVTMPHWSVIARCCLVAVTASFSHWLVYMATTKASAAETAPMVYVQLLTAVAIGVLFYGDYPDPLAMGGAALIIGAGLWLWNRQRRRAAVPAR